MEEASKLLQFLENELKEQRYFGGETIGLLDIAANIIGYWVVIFEEGSGGRVVDKGEISQIVQLG